MGRVFWLVCLVAIIWVNPPLQSYGGMFFVLTVLAGTILLALDNVECPGFARSVRDCLRSLAEGSQSPLKLVISATKSLEELFNDSQDGGTSPLAGICQSEVLKPWNEAIIRKFIDSRLKSPWLTPVTNPVIFTEEEIARLIAESGGNPQKLMQLCYQTYAGYQEEIQSTTHH